MMLGKPGFSCGSVTLMAALLLLGCGDDSAPGAGGEGTETDGSASDTEGPTSSDPTVSSDSGTTGGMSTSDDGSTGGLDSTGTTGADEGSSTGSETTGEEMDSPYRVVFSNRVGGTVRLYSATPDFEQVDGLTPAGIDSVALDGGWTHPAVHPAGRYVAFVRGNTVYAADVWTAQTEALSYAGQPIMRFQWSPTDPVLAWTAQNDRLWTASPEGADAEVIFELAGDETDIGDIYFDWSPLGDRMVLHSRPDGADSTKIWVIDADGTNPGIVGDPYTGINTSVYWAGDGDALSFVGNVSPDYLGPELCVGERNGYEVVSHPSGNVVTARLSRDRSRLLYLAGSGLLSANVDGTDGTLIDAGAPGIDGTSIYINDEGTWAAWSRQGSLTAVPTTLHTPIALEESGVAYRTVVFEPGGARLAYLYAPDPDSPATLRRVDGNGVAEVSHALEDGQSVTATFSWAGDGLRYVVRDEAGAIGVFHTEVGDQPLFVPEADEPSLDWVASPDGNLLVVRTKRDDLTGRLCAFDVADPTSMVELGCQEYEAASSSEFHLSVAQEPG